MYLLGCDIGSSSVKTALVEAATGLALAVARFPEREMAIQAPKAGWAEQDPEVWWQNLVLGIRKVLADHPVDPSDIKGIGIAYQMHGLVLVDQRNQVLRPAIIWCDSRAAGIGKRAFEQMGEGFCLENLLNSPGNFTASKLRWVRENEPELYAQIHKMMLPGDYIAMKLTAKLSTTISGLSEGILWNFKEERPAAELLEHYEIDPNILPQFEDSLNAQGEVSRAAAAETGLVAGTPVTYRAGDQPNNALSLNVLQPGEVAATAGTSGVIYSIVDQPIFDSKSRINAFAHVNHGPSTRIGMLLCINGAGIQHSWTRRNLFGGAVTYAEMEEMASQVPVGAEGLSILPFGNGAERIFADSDIGSHVAGLQFNRHSREHFVRAEIEGVAFAFVYGAQILRELGLKLDIMRVGNDNLFQSQIFSETISSLLDTRIELYETTGAIGAALAAGVGRVFPDLETAVAIQSRAKVYHPGNTTTAYKTAFEKWQAALQHQLARNNT